MARLRYWQPSRRPVLRKMSLDSDWDSVRRCRSTGGDFCARSVALREITSVAGAFAAESGRSPAVCKMSTPALRSIRRRRLTQSLPRSNSTSLPSQSPGIVRLLIRKPTTNTSSAGTFTTVATVQSQRVNLPIFSPGSDIDHSLPGSTGQFCSRRLGYSIGHRDAGIPVSRN